MDNNNKIMELCRLCLVKDQVNVKIFDEKDEVRQTYVKINACLPVKVSRDDNLPKRICDGCSYKLDMLYVFWNTSAESEQQLLTWLNASIPPDDSLIKTSEEANKKLEAIVKQETFDTLDVRSELEDNINDNITIGQPTLAGGYDEFPLNKVQISGPSTITSQTSDEPPPAKRPRRAAAVAAAAANAAVVAASSSSSTVTSNNNKPAITSNETDDEDDVDAIDALEPVTKVEGDSEESDDDNDNDGQDPIYVDVPSTSAAEDQPGPSGVNKASAVEAPSKKTKHELKNIELITKADNSKTKQFKENYCKLCSKFFNSPQLLNDHLIRNKHNINNMIDKNYQEKNYRCDICAKEFNKKQLFGYHIARHSKNFKVKCTECDKGFYKMLDYKNHYQARHKGIRFICEFCDKPFLDKQCFRRHVLTHDNSFIKQEYKCSQCNKIYSTKSGLNVHKKLHNNLTYICDICGKSINSKTSLNHHMMLHTGEKPFICETCGKCFNKKLLLNVHERIHTKEKPYECNECNKKFTQRSTLKIHLRSHTGERPYVCNICQKDFIAKTLLKAHERIHGTPLVDIKT